MMRYVLRGARLRPVPLLAAVAALMAASGPLRAQGSPGGGTREERVVTPGADYAAGPLHRLLFGAHNRDLWTTPIRVRVLDLRTFAGGLTPLQRGGGFQTRSLRFRGADGREYAFRSVDKDPSAVLPPDLRETLVDRIIQDQTSAGHPTAPLVVDALLDAVGVLHPEPQLVVMPDDPRLGEFRADFAGVLGTIEERPEDPTDEVEGFAGADNLVGTERLFERILERGERVDARAFLAARLVDLFLGDWDRHRDQWRWARFGEGPNALWQPVPRDRDQAFVRLDGLLLPLARRSNPQLVSFGEKYANIAGLTWNGRELDRHFLSGLERPVWDSIASFLTTAFTNDVVDNAVRKLPPEHYAVQGASLARTLRSRRDELPAVSTRFYELLADVVDVHATDSAEVVLIDNASDGTVLVNVSRNGSTWFRRRFLPSETREVRLYLYEGNDTVTVRGEDGGIRVRVIAGDGTDVFVTGAADDVRWYDDRGDRVVIRGRPVDVDTRPFESRLAAPGRPMRDWGSRTLATFAIALSPDIGVQPAIGFDHFRYAFRKEPFAWRMGAQLAYGTGAGAFEARIDAQFRRENSPIHVNVFAQASAFEVLRFHGFGNETAVDDAPSDFFKVHQSRYLLRSDLVFPLSERVQLAAGAVAQWNNSRDDENQLIGILAPYGTGQFGQVGLRARAAFDSRDRPRAASRGILLVAGAGWFPPAWDVESAFGDFSAEARGYFSAGATTFAARAGGRAVTGTYPFHEAAFIGDAATVRLGRKQRFAGDAELHGGAEIRQKLGRITLIIPEDVGILAFAEAGRVFLDGEDSNAWHAAFGGGFWWALLSPENTLSVSVARSSERIGIYLMAGFAF